MNKIFYISAIICSAAAVTLMLIRFATPINAALIAFLAFTTLCFHILNTATAEFPREHIHNVFIWLFITIMWIAISNSDIRLQQQQKQLQELEKQTTEMKKQQTIIV